MPSLEKVILEKLPKVDLTWRGWYDDEPVTVEAVKLVVGKPIKLSVRFKTGDEAKAHTLNAAYAGRGGQDTIELDGQDKAEADVDFVVRPGFPRSSLWFYFEFTDGADEHELSIQAKVNILDFLTVPV